MHLVAFFSLPIFSHVHFSFDVLCIVYHAEWVLWLWLYIKPVKWHNIAVKKQNWTKWKKFAQSRHDTLTMTNGVATADFAMYSHGFKLDALNDNIQELDLQLSHCWRHLYIHYFELVVFVYFKSRLQTETAEIRSSQNSSIFLIALPTSIR